MPNRIHRSPPDLHGARPKRLPGDRGVAARRHDAPVQEDHGKHHDEQRDPHGCRQRKNEGYWASNWYIAVVMT